MWLLYAFSGPVFWAVSTHIDKYLVDRYFRHSDTAVLMVFTALIGIVLLPAIWAFDPTVLTPSFTAMAVIAASGILYMGAMLFYLRAIQSEEASVVAPCSRPIRFSPSRWDIFSCMKCWAGRSLPAAPWWLAARWACRWDGRNGGTNSKTRLVLLMLAATFAVALSSVLFKFFAVQDRFWTTTFWTFAGEGLFGAAILCVPSYRHQFIALFRRNPGAVIGINGANELINLGAGLGVRFASLLAPVALVSAISSTSTFFVFLFGILLTLFFPRLGREDLSRRNLVQKGLGAVLITAGVVLVEMG